jgi:hypothetical protein
MPVVRTLLALLLFASLSLAAEVKLHVLGGKVIQGELVSIDATNVVLKSATGPVSTPARDVLRVEMGNAYAPLAGQKYTDVMLNDGTLLHCSQVALKGKQADVTVLPSLSLKLPVSAISYVLNDAQDANVQKNWKACLASKTFAEKRKHKYDMLATMRAGTFVDLYGTLGDGDDKGEKIPFELESGTKANPTIARIVGLSFLRTTDGSLPDTACTVEDTHKNQLLAAKLTVADGKCQVTTLGGVVIEYPDLKLLFNLDYRKGRLDYLSEMTPVSVEVSSSEDRIDKYIRDKNLDGGPIRLFSKTRSDLAKTPYKKGLVLLSKTVLVYNLNGDYQKFEAVVGVDALVNQETNATLTIEGDGNRLLSVNVGYTDEPKEIRVPIKGVRQLKITVGSELLDLGNHVVLADARVSK